MNDRYEAYERKVRRAGAAVRRGRGFVRMHRAVIITVIAVLAVLGAAALATAGLIVGETSCESVSFGAPPEAKTFVILGRARYEYAPAYTDEWDTEPPRAPGEYVLRAVTSRPFGGSDVGEPVRFEIFRREIVVQPDADNEWTWGEEPQPFCASLVPGDELVSADFTISRQYGTHADYRVIPASVVIRDAGGRDVTDSYRVTDAVCLVTYDPRPITVSYPDVTVTYDGSAVSVPDGRLLEGTTAPGDVLTAKAVGTLRRVGQGSIKPDIRVTAPDGTDVTACYDVTVAGGTVTILPYQVTAVTADVSKEFDGQPLSAPTFTLFDAGDFPDGHVLEILKSASVTHAGEARNEVTRWRVTNRAGEDVTDCFNITWLPGTLRVLPRPVTFRIEGYSCEYDARLHTVPVTLIEGGLPGYDYRFDEVSGLTDVGVIKEPTVSGLHFVRVSDKTEIPLSDFDVSYIRTGPLEVTPLKLCAVTGSDSKVYDGKPLDGMDAGFWLEDGRLPEGYILKPRRAASITEVGSEPNDMTDWVLVRLEDGKTVDPGNFKVYVTPGTLIVTAAETLLTGENMTIAYDGQMHTGTENARLPAPFDKYVVKVDAAVGYTVPGEYAVRPDVKTLSVFDPEGRDVTACFERLTVDPEWTLTIVPRPIVVKTDSGTFTYDGQTHEYPKAQAESGGLVNGHALYADTFTSVVHAGSVPNELLSFRIMDGKRDVTSFYEVTVDPGTLTVEPIVIRIRSSGGRKVYDGKPLSIPRFTYENEATYDLLPGHVLKVLSMAAPTRAGVWDNVPTAYTITDSTTGEDVTADYIFGGKHVGKLTIDPLTVQVLTGTAEKVYDGKPLTALSVMVFGETTLVSGDTISFDTGTVCYLVEAGSVENRLVPVVRNRQGEDVTDCYAFFVEYGRLTVDPRPLDVRVTGSKIYDGGTFDLTRLKASGTESSMLLPGHTIKLETFTICSARNAGQYDAAPYVRTITIMAGGRDVTACYRLVGLSGSITIGKRPITIRSDGLKDYDGKPLTSTDVTFVEGSLPLADGHRLTVSTSGSRTELGRSPNRITSYVISDASGARVAGNYEVTCLEGRLTVTCPLAEDPRPRLKIHAYEQTKTYDGKTVDPASLPLWVEGALPAGYTVRADQIDIYAESVLDVFGDIMSEPVGEAVNVGTYRVFVYEATVLDADGQDVTNDFRLIFDDSSGYVDDSSVYVILPRRLTLLSGSAAKMDDGLPLVCDVVTVAAGDLAPGDSFDAVVTGRQTGVGASPNTFSCVILNASGEDVTSNYDLTLTEGVLRIEE